MHISYIKRIFTSYLIIGKRFNKWISPIFTGIIILLLKLFVFIGVVLDNLFIISLKRTKISSPIIIVGNPRSGTTFLQRFLVDNKLGVGSELWKMIYPSIIIQKLIKPILPILEYISPAKHHSTDAHQTSLTSIETDDVGILFRYFDGFFLYGFILCWADENYLDWVDPNIRDNTKRDFNWLDSVWKRNLVTSGHQRIIAKLFSLSLNAPQFIKKYPDAKLLYMVRDPINVIPSGLSLVTGVLDKKFGFWNQKKEVRDKFIARLYKGLIELLNRFATDWNSGAINKNNVRVVKFDYMMNNFKGLMNDILDFINIEKDELLIKNIQITADKQKKYISKHKYDLEKFGLNDEKIKKDCSLYYETFIN